MLWYKSWLETRWRFLIGLALLLCSGAASVFAYPRVLQLLTMVPAMDLHGEMGRRIGEAASLAREYRGYVWSQWFRQNMIQLWTIMAVVLGTGGLLSSGSGGAALFTLSLPASRTRLFAVRTATALLELLVLALVPSLLISLLSPAVGQQYAVGDALVHGSCVFVAGAVFFSLATLLSTIFNDVWRPLLLALGLAAMLAIAEGAATGGPRYGVFAVVSGERYFRSGTLPWAGILLSVALSAGMLYGAAINLARRDF